MWSVFLFFYTYHHTNHWLGLSCWHKIEQLRVLSRSVCGACGLCFPQIKTRLSMSAEAASPAQLPSSPHERRSSLPARKRQRRSPADADPLRLVEGIFGSVSQVCSYLDALAAAAGLASTPQPQRSQKGAGSEVVSGAQTAPGPSHPFSSSVTAAHRPHRISLPSFCARDGEQGRVRAGK